MSFINPGTVQIGDSVDFCRLFSTDIDSLYSLALLLTGRHESAEDCLLGALESCLTGRPVPEGSVRSWIRWGVMRQAATVVSSMQDVAPGLPPHALDSTSTENTVMLAIAELPAFERFAFVVTVLEKCSIKECARLLRCKLQDVIQSRVTAMQTLSAGLQLFPSDPAMETLVESPATVAA
jgi:DNA-directed RNA polymerase specialized sigma24 family protein